jgi:hypothetical protein
VQIAPGAALPLNAWSLEVEALTIVLIARCKLGI